jgi:hypothetical protein
MRRLLRSTISLVMMNLHQPRRSRPFPPLLAEAALLVAAYTAYEAVRLLVSPDSGEAIGAPST